MMGICRSVVFLNFSIKHLLKPNIRSQMKYRNFRIDFFVSGLGLFFSFMIYFSFVIFFSKYYGSVSTGN